MNYKYKKIIFTIIFVFVNLAFVTCLKVNQARADVDNIFWGGQTTNIQSTLGLGNTDPRYMIANVVNIALGFMGIVAVMIIMMAGFKLMTTGGNEEEAVAAKRMMSSGVIGLVIVFSSFGLAQFVVNNLYTVTGATG